MVERACETSSGEKRLLEQFSLAYQPAVHTLEEVGEEGILNGGETPIFGSRSQKGTAEVGIRIRKEKEVALLRETPLPNGFQLPRLCPVKRPQVTSALLTSQWSSSLGNTVCILRLFYIHWPLYVLLQCMLS